jgi:hypothetical protein
MVNLGLIKDFNDCPVEIPRLSFSLPPDRAGSDPLLKCRLHGEAEMWDLTVPRSQGESAPEWMARLAETVMNLGQHAWCVNTHDLARTLQMPLDQALGEWGRFFWPRFRFDCVFYFSAGSDGDLIRKFFQDWQKKETRVCFREKYDLAI